MDDKSVWGGALRGVFETVSNVGEQNKGRSLKAFGARISDNEHGGGYWMARVGPCKDYYLEWTAALVAQDESPIGAWEDGEHGQKDDGDDFCPMNTLENPSYCIFGSLADARKLFEAIEAGLLDNAPGYAALARPEGFDAELNIALYEFEPEGLGMVQATTSVMDVEFDEWLEGLDRGMPELMKRMPMRFVIDSCGDYHCYCGDAFIEETSLEVAKAVWSHCRDKKGLRGEIEAAEGGFFVAVEKEAISSAAAKGKPSGPSASL